MPNDILYLLTPGEDPAYPGETFYCPRGHGQHYNRGPSEADKLRQERDRLKQDAARKDEVIAYERRCRELADQRAERSKRQTAAAKGQVTRLKNRASAGVCPCCNRQFQNLKRHMDSQHPDFASEAQDADNVVPLRGGQ